MTSIKTARTLTSLGYNILKAKISRKRQPIFLSLFITNRCNLRCKYCFVVDDKIVSDISYIDTEYVKSIELIDDVGTTMYGAMGANGVLKITLK